MEIKDKRIDSGKAFDWGRVSKEYARYRDIYPEEFYRKITERGLCTEGQNVLDLGTGTGVLPRNMYRYGARWTAADISKEQIREAEILAQKENMKIRFIAAAAEQTDFEDGSFDVVTACQCFWYFDHEKTVPKISRMLKDGGKLLILYMAWLPGEDDIAYRSEQIILKYSPQWTGKGEYRHPIQVPDIVYEYFDPVEHEEYDLMVPFTRESWHGRMKACRGVGASLNPDELAQWEKEHRQMLEIYAPEHFEVLHYAALSLFEKKRTLRD